MKKQLKIKDSPGATLYDYFKGDKCRLSHDGKKVHVVIIPNFSDSSFVEMGDKGFLIGDALKDYIAIKERNDTNTRRNT